MALKDEVLETLLQQIEEANVSVEYLSAGEHMTDGALQISCLHPYVKKVPEDRNDASLVLRLSQGDFQMLLTGDLEKSGEDWLVEQARPRRGAAPARCTKSPPLHHPRRRAPRRVQCDGEALLDLAQPELVLISCGKNNRYGHPAPETLKRLEERGIRWYSTAEVGAIQVHVGKKKVKIETSTSFSK